MAFLPSLGFLGFEIHIFYCNTPCLVWLPIQHRRKPISREPDFSVQKQGFLDGFLVPTYAFAGLISPNSALRTLGRDCSWRPHSGPFYWICSDLLSGVDISLRLW